MKIRYILPALLLVGGVASGVTLFTNADASGNNINVAGNWDSGLPIDANVGTISQDATFWVDDTAAGGGGGTAIGANQLSNYNLVIDSGASLIRGANFLPEFLGTTSVNIADGLLDINVGTGIRVLRLKNTSSVTVGSSGTLKLPATRNVEIFNSGSVVVNGGAVNAGGFNIATTSTHAFLTFGGDSGTVELAKQIAWGAGRRPISTSSQAPAARSILLPGLRHITPVCGTTICCASTVAIAGPSPATSASMAPVLC